MNFNVREEIKQIVKSGGHDDNVYSNHEVVLMVRTMVDEACHKTGINTHIGFDGVERNEDLILYLHSLLEKL